MTHQSQEPSFNNTDEDINEGLRKNQIETEKEIDPASILKKQIDSLETN